MQKSWVSMSQQFYERAKSTALLLRLPKQRQKQLISGMILFLDADSQWLLPPPPVSSNVATKKIRRSENYHFSRASAPNLPTARNHVEVALHESGADALQRLIQCHVGLSGSTTIAENFAIMKYQSNKILTSSGEHFVSRERKSSQIVVAGLMVVSYVNIACERCYCYNLPSGI